MNKITLFITWVASLILVYYLTPLTQQPSEFSTNTPRIPQSANVVKAADSTHKIGKQADKNSPSKHEVLDQNAEHIIDDFMQMKSIGGPLSVGINQMLALYTELAHLDDDGLAEAYQRVASYEYNQNTYFLASTILGEFARRSPKKAMEFVTYRAGDKEIAPLAQSAVASIWAETDAESAMQWYLENIEQGAEKRFDNGFVARSIFKTLAKNDLGHALSQISRVPAEESVLWNIAEGMMLSVDENTDMNFIVEELSHFNSPTMTNIVLDRWSELHPEQVADWLVEQKTSPAKERREAFLLRAWMRESSTEAVSWYMEGKEGVEQQQAITTVMKHWGYDSPKDAIQWIENQEGIDSDFATQSLLQVTASSDPEFTIENLDRIAEGEVKTQLMVNIVKNYYREDKQATYAFIERSPQREWLTEELQKYIEDQEY